MTDVECVWPVGAILGEGPHWSATEQALWFVDIKAPAIHRYHPASGAQQSWPAPARVGFVLPARGGTLIAGLKTGLHKFNPETGNFTLLHVVEPHAPNNRLNDGFVDAQGFLWFGSMDDNEEEPVARCTSSTTPSTSPRSRLRRDQRSRREPRRPRAVSH